MRPPGFIRLSALGEGGTSVRRALPAVICPSGVRTSGPSFAWNQVVAVRRRWMVWLAGAGLLAAGCSSSTTPTPTTSAHSASKSPAVSPGPCATVKTTTSIDQVPTACAALWAPYDVTKVPPPDILQQEHACTRLLRACFLLGLMAIPFSLGKASRRKPPTCSWHGSPVHASRLRRIQTGTRIH